MRHDEYRDLLSSHGYTDEQEEARVRGSGVCPSRGTWCRIAIHLPEDAPA